MIGKGLHRGLEREDVTSLIEAHDWIAGLANRDCDCEDMDGTQLDNPCDVCQARRAIDALNRVIDPTPRTLHPQRLKNDAERIYFELWCKDNERSRGTNGGFTLIEHLLHPEHIRANPITKRDEPAAVTQHDMTVATTVIQWLGTNGGRCFIDRAEKEIEKRRAERAAWGTDGLSQVPETWKNSDQLKGIAESIAAKFISVDKHRMVYGALVTAIHNALCKASSKTMFGGDA